MKNIRKESINNEAIRVLSSPSVRKNLDQDTLALLQPGVQGLVLEDAVFYLKKNISAGAGTFDLVVASDVEKTGTRNFNAAEFPALQHLILEKIELEYGTHATETDPAAHVYSSKKPTSAVPALMFGELIIEQNDKPIINLPIEQFFQAADGDDNDKKGVWLSNWRVIKAGHKFSVKIKFAEGLSIQTAAEQHCVSVKLIGSKTRKA